MPPKSKANRRQVRQSISFKDALGSSVLRRNLYAVAFGRHAFLNPLYSESFCQARKEMSDVASGITKDTSDANLRDFLASLPSFSDFSDEQLSALEENAVSKDFLAGEIIFKQGEQGDVFYVIHKGSVDVIINGQSMTCLGTGLYFGERALLTAEPRAATIKALEDTRCLVFSRDVFEAAISGSNALLGTGSSESIDWSRDQETRSLFRHVQKILMIDNDSTTKTRVRKTLYELSTAFTPELTVDELVARMVMTIKATLFADRVGLFVLTEDRQSMILKMSERAKGIRLLVRGLAGSVVQSNLSLNIADAYQDSRFDATMDRRTGYRSRQVMCVPLRHPGTSECFGVLQVNNRTNGSDLFTDEDLLIFELAANQLSELLYGRADVFIHEEEESRSPDAPLVTNSCDCKEPFSIQVVSICIKADEKDDVLLRRYVELIVSLHLGVGELCPSQKIIVPLPKIATRNRQGNVVIPLVDVMMFGISTCDIPRAARIMFRLTLRKKRNDKLVFNGWAAAPLYDFKGYLESFVDINAFEGENTIPINTTLSNKDKMAPGSISAILGAGTAMQRIIHRSPQSLIAIQVDSEELSGSDEARLKKILYLSFDPLALQKLTAEDIDFVWNHRYGIVNRAELLPALVMCTRWNDATKVQELYDLLDIWTQPTPLEALQLLDRKFMDPKVRAYAVHCVEGLKDEELSLYMLQLVQQLKFETHVDSALSRLLLRRALKNKRVIGHIFFWLLQSEVYNIDVRGRFTTLLQIYFSNCGNHRIELGQQMYVMKRLEAIAVKVCEGESKSKRLEILRQQLKEAVLPSEFQLPLDPHLTAVGFEIEGCRVMESKKKPLWLNLKNGAKGEKNIVLMLKVGDDLRQDALILQLLRIMNDLWKKEGLDMQMMIYGCISTGDERGLLEVVLNSSTLGGILLDATDAQKEGSKAGSLSRKITSALKALNDYDVLKQWIWDKVSSEVESEDLRADEMEKRVQNFILSTAAYCVASYVLGLGDRHNDNLMITKQAKFFHIDFGHILGNFKSKYGIKRERAPMVFTHAMKNVMRPDQYETFVDLCCDIYNILRRHSSLLVSLFTLSIPMNMPELQEEKDVVWIYEKLLVGKSDEEASAHFKLELELSLNTTATRMNDAVHMIAHA